MKVQGKVDTLCSEGPRLPYLFSLGLRQYRALPRQRHSN